VTNIVKLNVLECLLSVRSCYKKFPWANSFNTTNDTLIYASIILLLYNITISILHLRTVGYICFLM
jgi:hypothetical protein